MKKTQKNDCKYCRNDFYLIPARTGKYCGICGAKELLTVSRKAFENLVMEKIGMACND